MRNRRLVTLGLCLSIASLATFGIWHVATAAAAPDASAIATQCQELPVASPSASPTASGTASATASPTASPTPPPAAVSTPPATDLCVSVQAAQDTVQVSQSATWTVQVFAQNGPVAGVSVTLTGSLAGQQPVFTARCPGGDGNATCTIGDMGTAVTAASDQMTAQITIPSGTAVGTSVSLTATANGTPGLATLPSAATSVTVAAAPSPSASATSATPAASGKAAATAAATTPATLPSIGPLPTLAAPVTQQTQVTAVSNPGSIGSLLPLITPAAYATSPTAPTAGLVTAPAADSVVNPVPTVQGTSAGSFVFIMPAADAEKIGLAILLVMVGVAIGLRGKEKPLSRVLLGRGSPGAHRADPVSRPKPSGTGTSDDSPASDDSAKQTQG